MNGVYRDFLDEGLFITDIAIEKLANGMFKASSCGLEAHDHNQENAVDKLQGQLNEAMQKGEIHPGMNF